MKFFISIIFSLFAISGFSQEPLLTDSIEDKVAIGFPGITVAQLNQIQGVFANYEHIASAKYVFGNYKEMVIFFNTSQPQFKTYYDLLKIISPYYDVEKCYFDEKQACTILNNITNEPFFQVK